MKKILFTLAGFALLGSGKAWAISGGPFDNGDPAGLLTERGGFYQCTFSFKNGNGYGVFTPDAAFGAPPGLAVGGGAGTQQASQTVNLFGRNSLYTPNSSNINRSANRSVFYYKGITYAGALMGFVDIDARQVQGVANATGNDAIVQDSLASAGTGGGGAAGVIQSTIPIFLNPGGFILNLGWTAKISSTRPILRFKGKGEMAVLEPGPSEDAIDLAADAFGDVISSLTGAFNSVLTTPVGPPGFQTLPDPGDVVDQFMPLINGVLSQFEALTAGGSIDEIDRNAQKVKVTVNGSRRFF